MGPLPEMLEERESNVALHRVFAHEAVSLEIIEQRETRLPVAALAGLFDRAAKATGERALGLDVGLSMPPGSFGMWAEYSAGAETLGRALLRTVRTCRFQQSGGSISLVHVGRHSIWSYNPPPDAEPYVQHSDHLLGPMLRFLSAFLGPNTRPAWVELNYPRDPAAHLIEQAFEFPVHFGGKSVGVAFRSEYLTRARQPGFRKPGTRQITMLDVEANEILQSYAEPVQSIASILILRLIDGKSDIDGVAQTAGVGVQTLQRILRREGTSFRRLLDAARYLRAKAMLKETPQSVTEIGLSLGYSDPANFARAFARWDGRSPIAYRNLVSESLGLI